MNFQKNSLTLAICSALLLTLPSCMSTDVGSENGDVAVEQGNKSHDVAPLILTDDVLLAKATADHAQFSSQGDALVIDFDSVSDAEANAKWPGIKIHAPDGKWDWQTKDGMIFNIENPGEQDVHLEIKVADAVGSMGAADHQLDLKIMLPAGKTTPVEFYFNGAAMEMKGYRGGEKLQLNSAESLVFYTVGPVGKQQIQIHDVEFIAGTGENVKSEMLEATVATAPIEPLLLISDFSEGSQDVIDLNLGTDLKFVGEGEQRRLQVHYGKEESFPMVKFALSKPWDWTAYEDATLAFDIKNLSDTSATVYIRVDQDVDQKLGGTADGVVNSRVGYFQLTPGADGTYYFTLQNLDKAFDAGMRGLPPKKLYQAQQISYAWGEEVLDLSNVVSFQVYMWDQEQPMTLEIDNIQLLPNLSADAGRYANLLDQYGQYAATDWKGKIHDEQELKVQASKDLRLVKNAKLMQDRSRYGGWANGPKQQATGYFRTEKVDGQWSLVDPDGNLFFATGLANIRLDDTYTTTGVAFSEQIKSDDSVMRPSQVLNTPYAEIKKDREVKSELRHSLFNWLPDYDEALAQNYQYYPHLHAGPLQNGEVFSFFSANLMRKYAPQSQQQAFAIWQDVTLSRMMDWGFTSLGNWSDSTFYGNGKMPYFAHGWVTGSHDTIATGNDYWGPIHDPFDPAFRESVKRTVARVSADVKNDPWCVGVFVDNELTWGNTLFDANHYSLAIAGLRANGKESHVKTAYVTALQDKYVSIEKLNQAWESDIASWAEFSAGYDFDEKYNQAVRDDFSMLLTVQAEQYFKVVREELKAEMPNHLYLGARFADWAITPEATTAAAKYVDVMSYNLYANDLQSKGDWSRLERLDMPSIMGEFAFGATDSGMFHPGPIGVDTQQARGEKFDNYVSSVLHNPYFVGAHWFQYLDSPTTGRAWDGENYNNGFVTVTDTPYQALVDAAREVNRTLYDVKFEKLKK